MILDRLAPVLLCITAGALIGVAVWAALAVRDWLAARRQARRDAERAARLAALRIHVAAVEQALTGLAPAAQHAAHGMAALCDALNQPKETCP